MIYQKWPFNDCSIHILTYVPFMEIFKLPVQIFEERVPITYNAYKAAMLSLSKSRRLV